MNKIFELSWQQIQDAQQGKDFRQKIDLSDNSDTGADPIGDGSFKMIPSGDIVDLTERNKRLN